MANALVIKGTNFSANKLTTVTFGETPCTGISIDQSSISIGSFDDVEVEYTVTPANTTDPIIWESSNENVLTIADGVITPVGIGTSTITVSCGEFSDTADVSVSISIVPNWQYAALVLNSSSSIKFMMYDSDVYHNKLVAFGSGDTKSDYRLIKSNGQTIDNPFFIKIPPNAAKIKISATNATLLSNEGTYWDNRIDWVHDVSSGHSTYPQSAEYVTSEQFAARTVLPKEFTIPAGADAFVVGVRTNSTYADSDAETVAEETVGITIEFIPASN